MRSTVRLAEPTRPLMQKQGLWLIPNKQAALQTAFETLFYKTRDEVNREVTCGLIRQQMMGDYGALSTPGVRARQ